MPADWPTCRFVAVYGGSTQNGKQQDSPERDRWPSVVLRHAVNTERTHTVTDMMGREKQVPARETWVLMPPTFL